MAECKSTRVVGTIDKSRRHNLIVGAVLCAAFATVASSGEAARIYNFTNITVVVAGTYIPNYGIKFKSINKGASLLSRQKVTIRPGQKSPSLQWRGPIGVVVLSNRVYEQVLYPMCNINFGAHYQIQGGNYMVISQNGRKVTCTICNSHDRRMHTGSGFMPLTNYRRHVSRIKVCDNKGRSSASTARPPKVVSRGFTMEKGWDRPGKAFKLYRMKSWQNAINCRNYCYQTRACKAFTYAPGVCYLKAHPYAPVRSGTVTSGKRLR